METTDTTTDVSALTATALAAVAAASSADELNAVRVKYLGKQGEITLLTKLLGKLPNDQKRTFGAAVNDAKAAVAAAIDERKSAVSGQVRSKHAVDVTMPGIRRGVGRAHPLTQTMEEVKLVLIGLGFQYDDYPEVEQEWFNFDSLNTPAWHPSRDMHDSFYTRAGTVLRTHTTAFQMHAMKAIGSPPIRAMTSGRCYRRDEIDATHFPIFHQLDAIAIDTDISFADLKWTLDQLIKAILGPSVKLQFRPSYFPFTTPSAEVDVYYKGRWMELLGSGMMRPEVLRNGGIDPEEYQGFAFGMGIDRLTMARHGIDDIRLMYANEEAFLSQF